MFEVAYLLANAINRLRKAHTKNHGREAEE